jgi:hypothetical protein
MSVARVYFSKPMSATRTRRENFFQRRTDMLDYHNGKAVAGISADTITFEDGKVIDQVLSVIPAEIIGSKLLKVENQEDGVAYLTFGQPRADLQGKALPPLIIATVEATGDVLRGGNG